MIVTPGMEARYLGQRVKVLAVRDLPRVCQHFRAARCADVIYMSGLNVGSEIAVDEMDLEPLGATARPSFLLSKAVAS